MTRKVLIVTYHFPPSAAVAVHRMIGLVRHLPANGWQAIVVAPPNVPGEPEDSALLERVPAGTTIVNVPFPRGLLGRVAGRLAPLARWLPGAMRACRRVMRSHRPDALYTSSPPGCVHYLGLYMKRQFALPWAACLRDPWITNRRADLPLPRWQQWDIPWEARVMQHADAVIANTPLGLQGLQAAYPRGAGKMVGIPNGFDPENFPAPTRPHVYGARLTLLHAGELYSGRDPRPLLDALRDLEAQPNGSPQRPHFRVQFFGRTTEAIYDLATEIDKRCLGNKVDVIDQLPYASAIERMMAADILLLILGPGMRIGVPAKLYEYFGAGRPILALAEADSDVARMLRDSGVPHRIAPPNDAVQIRRALVEMAELVRGSVTAATPSQLKRFTRQHMAEQVAACLDRCVASVAATTCQHSRHTLSPKFNHSGAPR